MAVLIMTTKRPRRPESQGAMCHGHVLIQSQSRAHVMVQLDDLSSCSPVILAYIATDDKQLELTVIFTLT